MPVRAPSPSAISRAPTYRTTFSRPCSNACHDRLPDTGAGTRAPHQALDLLRQQVDEGRPDQRLQQDEHQQGQRRRPAPPARCWPRRQADPPGCAPSRPASRRGPDGRPARPSPPPGPGSAGSAGPDGPTARDALRRAAPRKGARKPRAKPIEKFFSLPGRFRATASARRPRKTARRSHNVQHSHRFQLCLRVQVATARTRRGPERELRSQPLPGLPGQQHQRPADGRRGGDGVLGGPVLAAAVREAKSDVVSGIAGTPGGWRRRRCRRRPGQPGQRDVGDARHAEGEPDFQPADAGAAGEGSGRRTAPRPRSAR